MDTQNIPSVGTPVTTTVKAWYKSTTVQIAIIQAVIGLLASVVLVLQNGLTVDSMGALAVGLKGILDLRQRFVTTQPIK
ncbi:MAG: hypothetical protein V4549_03480 [Bacteroidota bacterium]